MKYSNWVLRENDVEQLNTSDWMGFGTLASRVLHARKIRNAEEAREFLRTCTCSLQDPMKLKDMDRAVKRVRQALEQKEKIAIYGDYDVDGVTSVAILYRYLTCEGADVTWYIPDRLDEGYGMNMEALDVIHGWNVQLIITVDTGVTAVDEVEYAKKLGMDVVVTDHHECAEKLPDACAVVNPHRPDDTYPFKGLAGVGVAFKLICALCGRDQESCKLGKYGDFVALGTVADVMKLTDENRVLVRSGMCSIEKRKNIGIAKLMDEAGANGKKITTTTLGYMLAPRINAAGRMGQVKTAVNLLLTDNEVEAAKYAHELCQLNQKRQEIEAAIYQECIERWDKRREEGTLPSILVTDGEEWHPGTIGIVASKLVERYRRPVMMISFHDDIGKGSARSIQGFNLVEALRVHKRFLETYGGHEMAAGFSLKRENIEFFREHMEEYALDFTEECTKAQTLVLDCRLELCDATEQNVKELEQLEPYGLGNEQPVFYLEDVEILTAVKIGNGRHVRIRFGDGRRSLDAIWFGVGDRFPFEAGQVVDAAGVVDINYYRNLASVQMVIQDIRISEAQKKREEKERHLYLKLISMMPMSAAEAKQIYPEREHFVAMWRYLKRNGSKDSVIVNSAAHISRSTFGELGEKPSYGKTMVCLGVMSELGLLEYYADGDNLVITLKAIDGKVDLSNGTLMKRLREFMK